MEDKIRADFKQNNMTPYEVHIKYNIEIEEVYEILKEIIQDEG